MAELENLRTASVYINNQLLSRGLLRDGHSINFVDPGMGEGGSTGTMGRIIGVVNDLILRRDRDAELRESLSATLRTLRAENLRQTSDITRLMEKQAETRRKLDISESGEAALRTQLKSLEASVRGLKDDFVKAKGLVTQTRSQCAADVRRRDRQIDGLKKQLGESQRSRGSGKNPAVTVITVTGDVGAEKGSPSGTVQTASDGYDLRSETNEFLTELAKNLSEENEKLISVLKKTRNDLKRMSGWSGDAAADISDGHAVSLVANVDEIAGDLDDILDHLRTILTNPSFVPLEEVVVREDEINRLRGGWVQMETRWKEAVHLIDGWRKRMASNGRPVNDEELKMGLRLSPIRVRDVEETAQGMDLQLSAVEEEPEEESELSIPSPSPAECLHQAPAQPEYVIPDSDYESSIYEDDLEIEELDVEEPNVQVLGQSIAVIESSPLPEPPRLSPLKDSDAAGNRGTAKESRPRKRPGDFITIVEENTWDLAADAKAIRPTKTRRDPSPKGQTKPKTAPAPIRREPKEAAMAVPLDSSSSSLDSLLLTKPAKPAAVQQKPSQKPKPTSKPTAPTITKVTSSTRSTKSTESTSKSSASTPKQRSPTPARPQSSASEDAPQDTLATPGNRSARRVNSRLPLPRPANPPPPGSPLTMDAIAAKLAASEKEADAARVRAKLKAARMGRVKPSLAPPAAEEEDELASEPQEADPVKRDPVLQDSAQGREDGDAEEEKEEEKPVKRKRDRRASKVANRRRSTLSPWELESLISGNVVAAPAH